jgi:hypothetical protein
LVYAADVQAAPQAGRWNIGFCFGTHGAKLAKQAEGPCVIVSSKGSGEKLAGSIPV